MTWILVIASRCPVPWNAYCFVETAFWDTGALEDLKHAFWSIRAHAADGIPLVVVVAADDCLRMARVAIKMLVRALRVRLQLLTDAGNDWNMENFEDEFPVNEIMNHIGACVCACAEVTGNDGLDYVDFLDNLTDPVAFAEAIRAGARVNHFIGRSTSNCGIGGEGVWQFLASFFGSRLRSAETDSCMVVQPRGRAGRPRERIRCL